MRDMFKVSLVLLITWSLSLSQVRESGTSLITTFQAASADNNRNLLFNAGFEQAGEDGLPQGWHFMPNREGRGMVGLDTQNVHSGSHSVRLSPNAKNTEEGFGIFTQLDPELLKGKAITISGYAMMQGLSGPGAGVMLKTDRDNWLIFPQSGENKFVAFSKTFQISSNASEAYLFLIVGGKAGTVWVDDLSIRANQYPSATSTQAPKALTPTNDPYSTRINTPGWQDSAFITPDGKELYFAYMPYTAKDHLNLLLGKITEDSVKAKGPIRKGSYSTIEFETFKSVRKVDGGWGVPNGLAVLPRSTAPQAPPP